MKKNKVFSAAKTAITVVGLVLASTSAMAHIEANTDSAGTGINYGTSFFIHQEGTMTATSRQAAAVGGNINQTKSGAWNSNPGSLGAGWTHNSEWASVQFEDAADFIADHGGNNFVRMTFTVTDVDAGFDWDPGMTVWSGLDNDACPTGLCGGSGQNTHYFDNDGSNDSDGSGPETAWAEDLTFLGYDQGANSATFTTVADLNLVDSFTLDIAGFSLPQGNGTDVDFSLSVAVTSVPIPAAVYLFGTGLIGLLSIRRRATVST